MRKKIGHEISRIEKRETFYAKDLGKMGPHSFHRRNVVAYAPLPEIIAVTTLNTGLEDFVRAAKEELDGGKKVHIVHPHLLAESAKAQDMDPSPYPWSDEVGLAYWKGVQKEGASEVLFVEGHRL